MRLPRRLPNKLFLTVLVALALLPASAMARQVPSTAPVSSCPTVPFNGSVTNACGQLNVLSNGNWTVVFSIYDQGQYVPCYTCGKLTLKHNRHGYYVVGQALGSGTIVVNGASVDYRTASRRVRLYKEFFAPKTQLLFRPWLWKLKGKRHHDVPRFNFAEMTLFIPGQAAYPVIPPYTPAIP